MDIEFNIYTSTSANNLKGLLLQIASTTTSVLINSTTPVANPNTTEDTGGLTNSKLVEIIIYMVIWLFGTIGTVLVAYVVITSRKIKSTTNTHLLNLALADLVYLQGIPFLVLYVIKQDWIFPEFVCKLYFILSLVNQYTGIFILTMLSFDRFLAVCKPTLVELRQGAASKPCIAILWISGIFFMLPIIIYSNTETMKLDQDLGGAGSTMYYDTTSPLDVGYEYANKSDYSEIFFTLNSKLDESSANNEAGFSTNSPLTSSISIDYYSTNMSSSFSNEKPAKYAKICTVMWPTMKAIKMEFAFIIFGCIVSFLIPIITISYFYIRIIIRLKSSSFKFSKTESRFQQMKRKRINLMVLFIIGVSIVCYTPYWLFQMFLVNYYIFHPNGVPSPIFGQLATFFQLLIYFNAALNPYLYAFFSEIFLARFKEAFLCCILVKHKNDSTRRNNLQGIVCQPNETLTMKTRFKDSLNVEERSLLYPPSQLNNHDASTRIQEVSKSLVNNHSQTDLM